MLYSDLPKYLHPSKITGDKFRRDLLFFLPSNHLCILELTIGYASNLSSNPLRKKAKYKELVSELQSRYDKVHFVNLWMGALGTMGSSSSLFLVMDKDLDFDKGARSLIDKRVIDISIRTTYYIFCCRTKSWTNAELLNFSLRFFSCY